jgi:small subunit ribosomal protein S19e
MVTLREVAAEKFISRLKEELKKVKEIEPLAWSKFAKSGSHRQRPPEQPDFWYVRSASILRRIYLDGPVGVERLRSYYGGVKRGMYKGKHFRKSGGSILRKILQQLEKVGLIEKAKGGRKITAKGQKFLNKIAYEVSK